MTRDPHIPFSQRTGLVPIPPQLRLGEISDELRRLLHYAIFKDMKSDTRYGGDDTYFDDRWEALALDVWVRHLGRTAQSFNNSASDFQGVINLSLASAPLGKVFDLIEFLMRQSTFAPGAKAELVQAFVDSRAAYRVVDNLIVAVGTQEQAEAFERAVVDAAAKNAGGVRKHLADAGAALRNGDWAGSVRESIHAVESAATRLAPTENTLGAALKVIEKRGHLHGSLKAAFEKLYGYSSDEKGVRHALVFSEAKVDEGDALFMLGACAAFVSYLLARES